jgi:hypothetical protein
MRLSLPSVVSQLGKQRFEARGCAKIRHYAHSSECFWGGTFGRKNPSSGRSKYERSSLKHSLYLLFMNIITLVFIKTCTIS